MSLALFQAALNKATHDYTFLEEKFVATNAAFKEALNAKERLEANLLTTQNLVEAHERIIARSKCKLREQENDLNAVEPRMEACEQAVRKKNAELAAAEAQMEACDQAVREKDVELQQLRARLRKTEAQLEEERSIVDANDKFWKKEIQDRLDMNNQQWEVHAAKLVACIEVLQADIQLNEDAKTKEILLLRAKLGDVTKEKAAALDQCDDLAQKCAKFEHEATGEKSGNANPFGDFEKEAQQLQYDIELMNEKLGRAADEVQILQGENDNLHKELQANWHTACETALQIIHKVTHAVKQEKGFPDGEPSAEEQKELFPWSIIHQGVDLLDKNREQRALFKRYFSFLGNHKLSDIEKWIKDSVLAQQKQVTAGVV